MDNIIFALQRAGGISSVWSSVLTGVRNAGADVRFIEYAGTEANICRSQIEIGNDEVLLRQTAGPMRQMMRQRLEVADGEPFIYHSSYYRTCTNPAAVNVTTVHDFIVDLCASPFDAKGRLRAYLNRRAIGNSRHLVCVSENTRNDLLRLMPDIRANSIQVIHNGISPVFRRLDKCESKYSDCLMFVGGRQSYKNFEFAVRAVQGTPFRLLICGKPLTSAERRLLTRCLGADMFVEKVFPSDEDLNRYYNQAMALIYPSTYEGFGLPVVEAQAAGCPVIALAASAIPEVAGDCPTLMSTLTLKAFNSKLQLVVSPGARERLIEDGIANSRRFRAADMQRRYTEFYQSLQP